jgi:hypothetical protein
MDALRTMREKRLATVEVKADVQKRYNERIHAKLAKTIWSTGGCASWYQTRDGKNTTLWPGFTFEFRFKTRRFDAESYDLMPEPRGARPSLASKPTEAPAASAAE